MLNICVSQSLYFYLPKIAVIKTKMKVLLAGGTGFIGKHLAAALLERGHTVTVLSRYPGLGRITWDTIKMQSQLPPCDAVINLCGENLLQPGRRWTADYQNAVRNSRIGSNEVLVKLIGLSPSKPRVFVSSSGESYYPRLQNGEPFDESFIVTQPSSWMQQLAFDWERSAFLPPANNVRQVTMRIGVVLGRDGGVVGASWWPFYFGLGGVTGSGKQFFPWIHVSDLASLFIHTLESETICGPVNACAPSRSTNSDFVKAFGQALNRPTIFFVPEFVIKRALGPERAAIVLEGTHISPRRALETGFKFCFTDLYSAMKNIVK